MRESVGVIAVIVFAGLGVVVGLDLHRAGEVALLGGVRAEDRPFERAVRVGSVDLERRAGDLLMILTPHAVVEERDGDAGQERVGGGAVCENRIVVDRPVISDEVADRHADERNIGMRGGRRSFFQYGMAGRALPVLLAAFGVVEPFGARRVIPRRGDRFGLFRAADLTSTKFGPRLPAGRSDNDPSGIPIVIAGLDFFRFHGRAALRANGMPLAFLFTGRGLIDHELSGGMDVFRHDHKHRKIADGKGEFVAVDRRNDFGRRAVVNMVDHVPIQRKNGRFEFDRNRDGFPDRDLFPVFFDGDIDGVHRRVLLDEGDLPDRGQSRRLVRIVHELYVHGPRNLLQPGHVDRAGQFIKDPGIHVEFAVFKIRRARGERKERRQDQNERQKQPFFHT